MADTKHTAAMFRPRCDSQEGLSERFSFTSRSNLNGIIMRSNQFLFVLCMISCRAQTVDPMNIKIKQFVNHFLRFRANNESGWRDWFCLNACSISDARSLISNRILRSNNSMSKSKFFLLPKSAPTKQSSFQHRANITQF